jgi:ribose-phosphate pyrophosphokinase
MFLAKFVLPKQVMVSKKVKIFAGSASQHLAEEIAKSYGMPLGKSTLQRFSDGEFQVSFEETVRVAKCF